MVMQIQLFGALRKFSTSGTIILEVPEPCLVKEVRELIKAKISSEFSGEFNGILIDRSALANHSRVLSIEEQLHGSQTLSLLPPVCGG